jgi:hypothetical protein
MVSLTRLWRDPANWSMVGESRSSVHTGGSVAGLGVGSRHPHDCHQPPPPSVTLQRGDRVPGGHTRDHAIRLRGNQRAVLVGQPIVQMFTHSFGALRNPIT